MTPLDSVKRSGDMFSGVTNAASPSINPMDESWFYRSLSDCIVVGVWSTAPLQRRVGQWVLLAEQLGLIGVISPAISVASWDWREDGCSGNKLSEKLHRDLEKVSYKT